MLNALLTGYALNWHIQNQAKKTFYKEIEKQQNVTAEIIAQQAAAKYREKK